MYTIKPGPGRAPVVYVIVCACLCAALSAGTLCGCSEGGDDLKADCERYCDDLVSCDETWSTDDCMDFCTETWHENYPEDQECTFDNCWLDDFESCEAWIECQVTVC